MTWRKLWLPAAVASLLTAGLLLAGTASSAEQGHALSYAKSAEMRSNTTNLVNGVEQPGTLLRLDQPFSVRSLPIGDVRVGETLKVLSEVEVTNDLVTQDEAGINRYHDLLTGATLVIADSPEATTGIEVAEGESSVVTPEVHHWTFEQSGSFTADTDLTGKYLNLVMWASMPEPPAQCWTFPRSSAPSPQQPRDCGMDVYFNRGHLSVFRTGTPSVTPLDSQPFSLEDFSGPSVPETQPLDVPMTYSGEPAQVIAAMARPVGTLKTGDVITAHAELQADAREVVRSALRCNSMLATRLYLSPSPNSLSGARAIGTEAGYNFTGRGERTIKTLEQGVVPSSATFTLDRDYTTPMYVVLRVWAQGNSACKLYGFGLRIKLSQAESFMHVARYRDETQALQRAEVTNSGDSSEAATALDVVAQTPVSVYSVPVPALAAGDLLEVLGEVEVGTTHQRAAMHTKLILANSPTATEGTALQTDHFTEINPWMATLPIHVATGWRAPSALSGPLYVNLVMYGVGLQSLEGAPDTNVSISPDGGRLLVQRVRPADVFPPESTIDSGPAALINTTTASFGFSSPEAGVSFECRLDSASFGPCSGPGSTHTASGLTQGTHSFQVRALDGFANADPTPATRSFTVDSIAPQTTITAGPGSTRDRTPTFSFSSSETGSTFKCRIDSAPFGPCSGPGSTHTPGKLAYGTHSFQVRATDTAQNTDATPASRSFSVVR